MFFQIAVTPPNQTTKKPENGTPLEDVAVLKLAPFTPNPKIFFENVQVGEVDVKKLIIQNPNAIKNKLSITKLPPADRFVTLSWSEIEVEPHEEVVLELSWTPKEDGSWRDIITIRDGKNVDRNVPLIFKSLPKKGKKRVVKTKPTVIAVPAVKKFRSPKNTKKKRSPLKITEPQIKKKRSPLKITEPQKNMCMPISYKCDTCENNIHITTCSPLKKKKKNILEANKENSPSIVFQQKLENLSPIYQQKVDNLSYSKLSFSDKINRMNNSSFFSSPTNINFKCDNISQTPIRRETYLKNSSEELDDSLELEKKIDNICLSPEIKNSVKSAESFIKKLNLEMSPDVSVLNNTKNKTGDNYLVHKLLSDSFQFSSSTVTKTSSKFTFTLNDTTADESYLNNCSIKINRNNSSTPKELFKGNNTYEISPSAKASPNLSGDTYSIRSNISSSSTYAILSPEDARLKTVIDKEPSKIKTSSPLPNQQTNQFYAISNYLNFSGINVKNALSRISEEDTPSDMSIKNISLSSNFSNPGTKRKTEPPEMVFTVSPPKRAFIKPRSPKAKNINTTWSKKFEKTEKIRRKSISTLKLNLSKVSSKSNSSNVSTCSSVNITQSNCSIDPFLIAAMYDSTSEINPNLDPFISSTLYYDETWLEKQMQELKKWLNVLLTPPSELAATAESKKVDVAKLWQDCVKKDLIYAPTKEKVSSKYHTNHKLEILRKNAKNLFHSSEMRTVLSKVTFSIENKHLTMREDKNLHLDVGLQSHILTLLLCYNPLWLRIGLETIYNEPISLDSNSDIIGLSTFIMLRFFRCPELMPKNKQQVSHIKYLPRYATAIKKFTLKKFLMLVYFLDQAKNKKLISHDPCLFCRDAPVKESKELLLSFSREVLSAVGDVTKFLRRFGYEVSHKQSYIDEFDYAVKHLGVDLRDGIRLTKVMEIILLRNDLTNQLRGPAISRLQKIHNVKLALDSLNSAGYTIAGDITSKDIVDGNREKTLSLLWQIIYKFQAPRFTKAAIKIQIWWKSLAIVIKRKILDRPRQLKINSAIKIQQYYRSWILMKTQRKQFLTIKTSVITIQRFVRSSFLLKRDRLQYLIKRQAVVIIQQKYRAQKLMKIERNNYLELKQSTVFIQSQYRAKLMMKQTRTQYLQLKETVIKMQRIFRATQIMKQDRQTFVQQKNAAVTIQKHFKAKQQRKQYLNTRNTIVKLQQRFRATMLMRETRNNYLQQRKSAVVIQQKFRATMLMKQTRKVFLQQKQAALTIQQRLRANLVMKQQRKMYLEQRKSAIVIQQQFRAHLTMKTARQNYLKLKQATVCIQQQFRANRSMKIARQQYLEQKRAAVIIQRRFRANVIMKQVRNEYLEQRKSAIIIQQQFRAYSAMKTTRQNYLKLKQATICVQQQFRANKSMKIARQKYLEQQQSAIVIQQQFRGYSAMKTTRQNYLQLKQATVCVQQQFRANRSMKIARQQYLEQKRAAVIIQRRFRANLVMKQVRNEYLEQRKSAIVIQQQFRAYSAMKTTRQNYLKLKQAAICVQQQFRANKSMEIARQKYLEQQKSAIVIQQQFRAYSAMKTTRQNYLKLKQAAICVQQQCRANKSMKIARQKYLEQQKSAIVIQQQFRAYLHMKTCREQYKKLQLSTIFVQQQFRAKLAMRTARKNYQEKLQAIKVIQQKIKAFLVMKKMRQEYLNLRNSTIFVQQQFRANTEMKLRRQQYLELKQSAILIQQRYRATSAMKITRYEYIQQRNATIYIQRKLRAYLDMKKCKENYLELREAVINVQDRFRANQLMKQVRNEYLEQKKSAITIQRYYRSYSHMKQCRQEYLRLKEAALVIQEKYRANRAMKLARQEYLSLRQASICIQERFRANLEMKKDRNNYLNKRNSVVTIQKYFRSYLHMKQTRANYLRLKQATEVIQHRFRATRAMKTAREEFLDQKNAAIFIQKQYRAYTNMKKCRTEYLRLKNAALIIQTRFRANQVMKNERDNYLHQKKAAIFIQRNYRQYRNAKQCRESYLKLKQAVLVTQRRFRANRAMKTTRENYLKLRNSVLVVQQKYRAHLQMKNCRKEFQQQIQSVKIIQNKFRAYIEMKKCRQQFIQLKKSTCIIQQRFREYLLMKQQRTTYMEKKKSTITIQKYFRSYLEMKKCRQEFLVKKGAAIKIQKYFRAYCKRKIILKQQITIKSVIRIQCWVRRYLAIKKLENLRENSKDTEEKRQLKRLNNAATKIQALWRGYKTRKAMNKKLVLIHQKSVEANNQAAPEFSVGRRNREAIDVLMYQTSMKEIIRALTILDFTTRLFPNLCIEVCDEITERLYILLCFTNRSVPDMDASILCVSVLINLYKFPQTSSAVWKTQYLDRLLSLLLHWSEKDGLLFPYVCTLIWLFAQNKEYCQVLKSQENVDKILKKTFLQCQRRQKMLTKMRNAPVAPVKGQKDVHPFLKPDWGIININKPRVFKNPVFAIKCLLKHFNL